MAKAKSTKSKTQRKPAIPKQKAAPAAKAPETPESMKSWVKWVKGDKAYAVVEQIGDMLKLHRILPTNFLDPTASPFDSTTTKLEGSGYKRIALTAAEIAALTGPTETKADEKATKATKATKQEKEPAEVAEKPAQRAVATTVPRVAMPEAAPAALLVAVTVSDDVALKPGTVGGVVRLEGSIYFIRRTRGTFYCVEVFEDEITPVTEAVAA